MIPRSLESEDSADIHPAYLNNRHPQMPPLHEVSIAEHRGSDNVLAFVIRDPVDFLLMPEDFRGSDPAPVPHSQLEPSAPVGHPPAQEANGDGCSERPPEWQSEVSKHCQDREGAPEDPAFHAPSLLAPCGSVSGRALRDVSGPPLISGTNPPESRLNRRRLRRRSKRVRPPTRLNPAEACPAIRATDLPGRRKTAQTAGAAA